MLSKFENLKTFQNKGLLVISVCYKHSSMMVEVFFVGSKSTFTSMTSSMSNTFVNNRIIVFASIGTS